MFKYITIFCLSALATTYGNAQTTQDRQVGEFTGLKVSSNIKVMLSQGEINSLKVEADQKDQANIITEVKDGTLEITGGGKDEVTVYLTAKTLNSIEVSGAGIVKSVNQFTADKLKLETSGAGSVKLMLKAGDINGSASGASVMNLQGTATSLTVGVSGAANLKAYNLVSEKVDVTTAGAGTAKVNVVQSITAHSSGASSITFKGDPKDKIAEMSGASSISKFDGDEMTMKTPNDTMKVHIGKNNVIICDDDNEKKEHKSGYDYWSGLELGMNGYLNADNTLSMPGTNQFLELNYGKSLAVNLNIMEHNFHIYKNYVNLVTGLGFEFNHYSFKRPTILDPNSDVINAYTDSAITSYDKNKLNVSYVDVPLLLMFNTNHQHPSKGFHIGGGVIGGYKIRSVTKQEFSMNGFDYDIKKKDDYNLNPFRLSATVRAGVGGFNLFATYALTSLFEDGKGPRLYPFTVGIAISGN